MSGAMTAPMADKSTEKPLLQVHNLSVDFTVQGRTVRAVKHIAFEIGQGETVALVGESGSGKSVSALSILQLLPYPTAQHPGGSIRFEGVELLDQDQAALRKVRGNDISIIFQEPMTSLNPLHTVEKQISEILFVHRGLSNDAARLRVLELLRQVGLGDAEQRLASYPHQLSGGQRQRVMIAMALANEPKLLIADEPTTALDVTIQAQILDLMRDLRERTGTAIMLITHDLGVIAELADRVVVMYAGKVVEEARVGDLFTDPQHPYTLGLLGSIPKMDVDEVRLATIEGSVPNPYNMPAGCKFNPRCPFADDKCRQEVPALIEVKTGHKVACWKAPLEDTIL